MRADKTPRSSAWTGTVHSPNSSPCDTAPYQRHRRKAGTEGHGSGSDANYGVSLEYLKKGEIGHWETRKYGGDETLPSQGKEIH